MKQENRLFSRIAILALNILAWFLLVFVVLRMATDDYPVIFALALTYGIGAYGILPAAVRLLSRLHKHHHIKRYTLSADGLPADPVNLAIVGTRKQLDALFAGAGWDQADKLNLKTSLRMVKAFVLNQPYPTAPFSNLYLFGRKQDVGFQLPIDGSPRQRHHVRFWAATAAPVNRVTVADFWRHRPDFGPDKVAAWIGAASKDTGIGLTKRTFQITHDVDEDINAERDYIIGVLKKTGLIKSRKTIDAGKLLDEEESENHFVTDGKVVVLNLQ